jgi:hypothetical protein
MYIPDEWIDSCADAFLQLPAAVREIMMFTEYLSNSIGSLPYCESPMWLKMMVHFYTLQFLVTPTWPKRLS